MAGRSPARFLAPLALVAVVVALYMVLKSPEDGTKTERTGGSQATATATATPKPKRKRKVYVVKPGDTPSGIADKTGVSLEELEKANPKLDPQLLAPGQRIRLPQ